MQLRRSIRTKVVFFAALFSCCASLSFAAQTAEKDAIVEGTVTDPAGKPIASATVRVEREGKVLEETKTGGSGQYTVKIGNSGSYRLHFEKDGYSPQTKEASLKTGKNTVNIVLETRVAGKIEFSDAPNFTVAGVTDWSNVGLHGSDAKVKTSETLSKETAALKPGSAFTTNRGGAGETRRRAGDEKEKAGDPLGAVKEYEAAVKLDGSEENYFAWGTELLLHRAGLAAAEVLRKGAELHPKSERMFAALGAAYYANGQYAEAAEQICHASDLNPADVEPYLFLGRMEKAAVGISPCSEEKLSRFANEKPKNAQANYFYGLVLLKRAGKTQSEKDFDLAEKSFRQAIAIAPQYGEVYVELGMMYNARGKKDAALEEFQKAVAASPDSSAAHYQLSLAYRRSGNTVKASEEMKTYNRLRESEEAALEKERREMRQFVTVLKQGSPE
jgi:tetratricopeptide (TPR) repeat protein